MEWKDHRPPSESSTSVAAAVDGERGSGGLQRSGHVPGRWATADGDFYCDSFKSQGAMGPRQLTVKIGFFLDGDSWRRRGPRQGFHEGSRGFFAISLLVRILCEVWLYQLPLYPVRLCMRTSTCTFSLSKNTDTYYQKKIQVLLSKKKMFRTTV